MLHSIGNVRESWGNDTIVRVNKNEYNSTSLCNEYHTAISYHDHHIHISLYDMITI